MQPVLSARLACLHRFGPSLISNFKCESARLVSSVERAVGLTPSPAADSLRRICRLTLTRDRSYYTTMHVLTRDVVTDVGYATYNTQMLNYDIEI